MIRHLIPATLCCLAALPAAEGGKGHHARQELGAVLGRQVIDAGHILEARAVPGAPGQVLIRWGDIDNVITGKSGKGSAMAWAGSAEGSDVKLVRIVAFEGGSKGRSNKGDHGKAHGDRLTSDGYAGDVAWSTRTTTAWDGVVVSAAAGSQLKIASGSASVTVAVP